MTRKRIDLFIVPIAVILALIAGSILILLSGKNPLTAYAALFSGAFIDYWGLADTLVRACPLILTALAFLIPFQTGLFNIGAEGQLYAGALFGTIVALYLTGLPVPLHITLCFLAGFLGGALWGLIPAVLRAYYNVNELIVSLMLNYVAINIVGFLLQGPMSVPGAPYPYSDAINPDLELAPILSRTDAHWGILVAAVACLFVFLLLNRSTSGFSLRTVGRSVDAARYAGMSAKRQIIQSMMAAGGLAGIAGAIEILGVKFRLFHAFASGVGFEGIIVAFLAQGQAALVLVAGFLFAGLQSGAGTMQRAAGVDVSVVDAIQGIIILFVTIGLSIRFRDKILSRISGAGRSDSAD